MDTGETLEAGLLKIGHHGSDTGTSLPFLQAVAPEAAVISVGEGNSYDMPHDSVLDRLGQMGVALYRTDLQGTIVAQTQGETWEIQGGIPAPVLDSGNPQEASYVGNQNSKVFHRPDCPSVGKMKEENQVGFASRQEALDQGYDPCQNCNP